MNFLNREKFYTPTYENPLVDAMEKQCPDLKKNKKSKFDPPTITKRLSGEEILNILCNGACEILKEEESSGKLKIVFQLHHHVLTVKN